MRVRGSGTSQARPQARNDATEWAVGAPGAPGTQDAAGSGPGTQDAAGSGPGLAIRVVAFVAAGALALGIGFGVTRLFQSSGAVAISSTIPSPLRGSDAFVEDHDGTGQDSQTNILRTTAPGLVHILSGGAAVGIGMVLTPSGKVLTTYQPSSGSGGIIATYVLSGKSFRARVIGTDAQAGLSLLQLEGTAGRGFPTLKVGNSATLVNAAYDAKRLSYHVPGEVDDTAVGTSGTRDALIMDVGTLAALNVTASVSGTDRAGLLQSALQAPAITEVGGPLVDLNGNVIGITVGGAGSGLRISGYAIPINQALAIAKQLDAKAGHTS